MDTIITDFELDKACAEIAAEIFTDIMEQNIDAAAPWEYDPEDFRDDMNDRAHEAADGHQWTIYTHYALSICAHCNTDMGEEMVDDIWPPEPFSLSAVASSIVYGEIRGRIEREISTLIEEYEAPEQPEEADDEVMA